MRLEGIHAEYSVSLAIFREIWNMRRKKNLVVKDWTITDFDNALKGNPIVRL